MPHECSLRLIAIHYHYGNYEAPYRPVCSCSGTFGRVQMAKYWKHIAPDIPTDIKFESANTKRAAASKLRPSRTTREDMFVVVFLPNRKLPILNELQPKVASYYTAVLQMRTEINSITVLRVILNNEVAVVNCGCKA